MSTQNPNINAPQDLSDDPIPVDFNDMAEQRQSFDPTLQPGTYRFKLPDVITPAMFEQYQVAQVGPRLRVNFYDDKKLRNLTNKTGFQTQLNNTEVERKHRKTGVVKRGSDMHYLIGAVGGTLPPGAGNKTMRDELLKHGGKEFLADSTLTATCNPNRDIYVGGQVVQGRKGCGQKYVADNAYQIKNGPNTGKWVLALQRDANGVWAEGVQCKCGAEVRAFANLQNFRAVE